MNTEKIQKLIPTLAYLVTILDGPRVLIVMDHTRDLDAVCEAMDQINRHKENRLRPIVEGDTLILTYNDHPLLRGQLPHPLSNPERAHILGRFVHHMPDLRAIVGVGAASDAAMRKFMEARS